MKRSVAIYGPTPQFVRWTIKQACPFRELSDENLCDRTFRQLRSIRELSLGIRDGRLIDQFCLHPSVRDETNVPVLGFPAEEVWQIYGSRSTIESNCNRCPANALSSQTEEGDSLWAGCYGWLISAPTFRFGSHGHSAESLAPHEMQVHEEHMVDWVHEAASKHIDQETMYDLFPKTNQAWYSLWQSSIPNRKQLEVMQRIFEKVLTTAKTNIDALLADQFITGIEQFVEAIKRCLTYELELHTELVTAGLSDGLKWETRGYCPTCKAAMELDEPEKVQTKESKCLICGRRGNPTGGKKSKVLGLRPFVQLNGIVGAEKVADLVQRYQVSKSTD